MRAAVVIALAASLVCCDRHDDRIEQLAAIESRDRAAVRDLAREAERLQQGARLVVARYREVERAYQRARSQHEAARIDYAQSAANFDNAERRFRDATEQWHRVAAVVIALAAAQGVGQHLCNGMTSTRQFREQLRRLGIDPTGMDVDHVLPHSLGGANHPLNYNLIESSVNRSMGARILPKVVAMPTQLLQGVVVSALMRLQCGQSAAAFGR